LCAEPITDKQVQYELADNTFTRGGTRLHLWCHAAWQMEFAKAWQVEFAKTIEGLE
jgi:hypothetical protein